MLELRRMAEFLRDDEETFAETLVQKSDKELLKEQKHCEDELQKAIVRNDTVSKLYEKLYEDNATGKVSDEWFMQLSHKYEIERLELKSKISELRKKLSESGKSQKEREDFIYAVRQFMQMNSLTAPLLRELIDHIDVFETEGTGKNRTQRVVIYYRFVGYVEIPDSPRKTHYKADTRQGVAVEYLTEPKAS
jgi:site-specific DNA recombinase